MSSRLLVASGGDPLVINEGFCDPAPRTSRRVLSAVQNPCPEAAASCTSAVGMSSQRAW